MMLICADEDCKFKCGDLMSMQQHRQQIHREPMIKAMEGSAISLVEAILTKHGIDSNTVVAKKEDVDKVIQLLEKGI